jgi:hypothetical protein
MRQALLLMFLFIAALPAPAGGTRAPLDSSAHRYEGLFFEFRVVPQYEVGPSVVERGEIALLGPGYAFSRMCVVSLLFATGSRVVEPSGTRPVNGEFGFGGARLEITYSPAAESPIRPFCSAGAGLYSIINVGGFGYNGNGVHAGAGVGWEPTDFFRSKLGIEYDRMRFYNQIRASGGVFEPFTLNSLGVSLSVSFVPGIVP